MKDWFKANVHLQDILVKKTKHSFSPKNVVMSSLVGAGSQKEFNSVINTIVVQIFDPNDL